MSAARSWDHSTPARSCSGIPQPAGVSQYRLAKETGVPPRRSMRSSAVFCRITAHTPQTSGRYFGTSERSWLNLQTHMTWG